MRVVKISGEESTYNPEKIRNSLVRSGTPTLVAEDILKELESHIYEGISTKEIFKTTHRLLGQYARTHSAKYGLKQAILQLGPSGYPFEKLIGDILKKLGFQVEVGITMQGACVSHEVDVFAQKDDLQYIVECKFHNKPGFKSDVKVPLYIHSRFRDIEKKLEPEKSGKAMKGWVVTNTRFTQDAITYGECVGLKMMSWDYPEKNSLKQVMTDLNLHPITSLTSLSKFEKEQLIDQGIILCRTLLEQNEVLQSIVRKPGKINRILKEIQDITR